MIKKQENKIVIEKFDLDKYDSFLQFVFYSYNVVDLDKFLINNFILSLNENKIIHTNITFLPIKTTRLTLLRDVFKHEQSMDHFELRIHRRIIRISNKRTIYFLNNLKLPETINFDLFFMKRISKTKFKKTKLNIN